ncbi:MAG: beta-galactosidase [Bryobacteraceae bacterium]|nr:beta-galactosidase [Bryobacteraceae bacterium]
MTRRNILTLAPAGLLSPVLAQQQPPADSSPARMKPRTSKSIASSPISIGFETLDRQMFDPERTYAHLAKLGVKWARCQTGWARTETVKGKYDFEWLDRVVDSLLAAGVQPWFNLGYGNTLYTPGPTHPSAVGWIPLNSDDARAAWLRYTDAIATKFATRVKHWELWNEPNISNFWQPDKPDPTKYVEFVKMTAPVIRKRVPGVTLIGGVFAGIPLDYIDGAMAAGLGDHVDRISYHPYRAVPEEGYDADIRALKGIVNRYKPGMKLWQGENGAPSTNNSTGALREFEWDEARQAKWLLRRLITDLSYDIEVTSYFQTVDMQNYVWTTGNSGMTNSKGVLRGGDYTPKASYYALQNLCSVIDSDCVRTDLLVRVSNVGPNADPVAIRTASFVKKGVPLYFWWYPANLQKGFESRLANVNVWSGNGAKMTKPVLCDLLTGDVWPAPARDKMPLRDYPMLLTDASLIT